MNIEKLDEIIAGFFNVDHNKTVNTEVCMDVVYELAELIKKGMDDTEDFDCSEKPVQIVEPKHSAWYYR